MPQFYPCHPLFEGEAVPRSGNARMKTMSFRYEDNVCVKHSDAARNKNESNTMCRAEAAARACMTGTSNSKLLL